MKVIQYIKINHLFNRVAFASGVILTLLAIAIHLPIISNGEQEAQAAAGTAQESSITMNFASNTASVDLAVSSSDGAFATSSESNKASFSIITNNYTGYTLTISAPDDNGTLVNGNDSLTSIGSNLTASEFNTTSNNGKWGWMPNVYQSNDKIIDNTGSNAVYLPSPTTTATTLDVTNSANATAKDYSISLGARADYTKSNGTYSKTFVLTAVANEINYSVTYDKNTTDTVTNMPYSDKSNVQSGDTSSTSITLSNLVPERDGYTFKGWCSVATSDETCSGTVYNPNGDGTNLDFGIDQTTINTETIYAIWHLDKIYMQDLPDSQCTTTARTVYDSRDEEPYLIQRLADGNCWLLDNLRFDIVAHKDDISSANTNAGDGTINYLKGVTTRNPSTDAGGNYATAGVSYWGTSNSYSAPLIAIKNASDTEGTGWNPNTVASVKYGDGSGKIGVYYNFCAASAGSYCYGNGTSEGTSSGNATEDICPAGWRMPTGDSSGEYQALATAITGSTGVYISDTDATNFKTALSTPLSGRFVGGSAGLRGSEGQFWASASMGSNSMNSLDVSSSYVVPYAQGHYRYYGSSVRCLLDERKYLQDQTSTTLATDLPNVGDTGTYVDKRDGEKYLVGHLADGNYWLLDNLRLDLTQASLATLQGNTNAGDETLNYLKGVTTRNPSTDANGNYATAGVSYWGSSYNYSAPLIAIKNASDDTWNPNTTATSYGSGSGKIGVYYNYCAASAGSYCYGNGTSQGTSSGDAGEDICPASWRMPTGGADTVTTDGKGEYQALYTAYSSNATNFRDALSTPLSGSFARESARDQGSYGYFWSSTRDDDYSMYNLTVSSSNVSPQGFISRVVGRSVRCLLKQFLNCTELCH